MKAFAANIRRPLLLIAAPTSFKWDIRATRAIAFPAIIEIGTSDAYSYTLGAFNLIRVRVRREKWAGADRLQHDPCRRNFFLFFFDCSAAFEFPPQLVRWWFGEIGCAYLCVHFKRPVESRAWGPNVFRLMRCTRWNAVRLVRVLKNRDMSTVMNIRVQEESYMYFTVRHCCKKLLRLSVRDTWRKDTAVSGECWERTLISATCFV